ncbi:hypothetical protein JYT71_00770 [Acidimicrobiaceae bacterium AH-315-P05]|nr:hypothetical protein [Acidimicrobiaceae bacterium AH-315-P05]
MKKIALAVALAIALVSGLFAFTGGDSFEIGDSVEAVSELPELGPIELITNQYNASQQAACSMADAGFFSRSFCVFVPTGVPGFTIGAATTIDCVPAGAWTFVVELTVCANPPGPAGPFFSSLVALPGPGTQNDPCIGTHFATITLTNPGSHTLVINVTGNRPSSCS